MILRTKETPRFGGVINYVFDTSAWDNAYPTTVWTETACVRKRLTISPVFHDTKYQAASHFCTLYWAVLLLFQKISSLCYLAWPFRLSSHLIRLSTESVAEATITLQW